MFSRILFDQLILTGHILFSNETLLLTGKFAQAVDVFLSFPLTRTAHTCSRNKSKLTFEKVKTKGKKKPHRAERSTADRLKTSYPKKDVHWRKVTVVGSGQAAVTSTLALLATETTQEVCMLGVDSGFKIQGEAADIQHASVFLHDPKIVATKDHADSKGSEICVIATGTEQGANEDNYEFTSRNSRLIHDIIPELMRYSPDAVYLIASDPVDVLTREAWIAGGMHQNRILGTGTNLYSAMLRTLISGRLGVHAASCHGLVLGQNNPCSNPCANSGGVPVWSGASVRGVRLIDINPEIGTESDPEKWQDNYEGMIKDEQLVRKLKGGYKWATALSVVDICQTILSNSQDIRPVSTFAKGKQTIEEDVFLSLPCILGSNGIVSIVKHHMSAKELFLLRRDARKVAEIQTQLKIIQQQ